MIVAVESHAVTMGYSLIVVSCGCSMLGLASTVCAMYASCRVTLHNGNMLCIN